MSECEHVHFRTHVTIRKGGGATAAEIEIACATCRKPFRFMGIGGETQAGAPRLIAQDGSLALFRIEPVP